MSVPEYLLISVHIIGLCLNIYCIFHYKSNLRLQKSAEVNFEKIGKEERSAIHGDGNKWIGREEEEQKKEHMNEETRQMEWEELGKYS